MLFRSDEQIIPEEAPQASARKNKRKSEQIENTPSEDRPSRQSTRTRTNSIDDAPNWTAISPAEDDAMDSTPPRMLHSTPPRMLHSTPPRMIQQETPPPPTPNRGWEPIDVDVFLGKENIPAITQLTSPEKQMTIEEFLLHEAKRQEVILREQMLKQVSILDAEYHRALDTIDSM